KEVLAVPQAPVVLKGDTYAIWPMNQPLGDAVLKYATAQPLCRLNVDGGLHYFFKATDGVAPEYVFDSQTITSVECRDAKIARSGEWTTVGDVQSGTECLISLTTKSGRQIKISTLTSDQAEQCYKAKIWGRERVFLSSANLVFEGQQLQLLHCGREKARESANSMGIKTPDSEVEKASFGVFPPVVAGLATGQKPLRGFKDGIFDRYPVAVPRQEPSVTWEALPDAECRRSENALAGAQWIWSDINHTNPATAYFRKEFTVPEGAQLKRATLAYSAANYAKLWLNAQLMDEGGSTAMVPPVLTVTDRLHPGRNVIAASAANPASPGGWIAKLMIEFQDGTSQTVVADPTSKSAKAEQGGWSDVDLDDDAWTYAGKIADWGCEPWAHVPKSWYGPTRKAWHILLPPQATEGLSDILLRISYVGDVAFLTESRSGRLLADNFYNQPLWEVGLRHFSSESLRGGVVLWITPLKKDAPIYMPEESRPKFARPLRSPFFPFH
ncbi:MAG: hypothetical protein NT154_13565, partial [Verrucomicrobia bacterium]|nr:hypothetical protein [Verrucomicrobiota bacterium]